MRVVCTDGKRAPEAEAQEAVVEVMPVWARSEVCQALTGVPHLVILGLFNRGLVRARKMDPAKPKSVTVFKVADLLEWLDTEAGEPPKFKVPAVYGGGASRSVA